MVRYSNLLTTSVKLASDKEEMGVLSVLYQGQTFIEECVDTQLVNQILKSSLPNKDLIFFSEIKAYLHHQILKLKMSDRLNKQEKYLIQEQLVKEIVIKLR